MQAIPQSGKSEVELWAELQRGNHIRGGEWIETRIPTPALSSGPRTNPWLQEAGPRTVRDGNILAFDTDMIGTYGYFADLFRNWKMGDGAPTGYEKKMYWHAYEQLQHNASLLKAGVSLSELTAKEYRLDQTHILEKHSEDLISTSTTGMVN